MVAERQTGTTEEGQDSNNYVEPIKTVRVGEDFPARVRNVRKKLWPFLRKCMSEQKNAYIKYDKLIVDDNIYVYDYAKKAPVLVSKWGLGRGFGSDSNKNSVNNEPSNSIFQSLTIGVWNVSGLQSKLDGSFFQMLN